MINNNNNSSYSTKRTGVLLGDERSSGPLLAPPVTTRAGGNRGGSPSRKTAERAKFECLLSGICVRPSLINNQPLTPACLGNAEETPFFQGRELPTMLHDEEMLLVD